LKEKLLSSGPAIAIISWGFRIYDDDFKLVKILKASRRMAIVAETWRGLRKRR